MTSAVLLAMLTGCKDASADINDRDTVMFKVGNQTITKGTVYDMLVQGSASDTVMNGAQKRIAAKEIEITDEIRQNAQETIDMYQEYYGDDFNSYLESMGMTTEDYINTNLIPSIQIEQLSEKYVEEHFDELVSTYKPVKATLLEFSDSADADAALSELKDGSADPAAAASAHNSYSSGTPMVYTIESSSVDSLVRSTILNGMTPDDGWVKIPASDGATFVLAKIDDNDPANFREDIISNFRTLADISTASTTYWLNKYNFHVYDITVYEALKAAHPEYLVQDGTPATEAPAEETPAEETPAAETEE